MRANFVFLTPARITQRGTQSSVWHKRTHTQLTRAWIKSNILINVQKYYIKVVTMIIDNKPFRSLTGQLKNTYKEKKTVAWWENAGNYIDWCFTSVNCSQNNMISPYYMASPICFWLCIPALFSFICYQNNQDTTILDISMKQRRNLKTLTIETKLRPL